MKTELETYGDFEISWDEETRELTVSLKGMEDLTLKDYVPGDDIPPRPRQLLPNILPWEYLSDPDGYFGCGDYKLSRKALQCVCSALQALGYIEHEAREFMQKLLYQKAKERLK